MRQIEAGVDHCDRHPRAGRRDIGRADRSEPPLAVDERIDRLCFDA